MQATNPQRVLAALQDYWAANRAMPSFGAVAKLLGLSVSTVADSLTKLKGAHYVKAGPTGRLLPGRKFFERPLMGRVQAGLPIAVADEPAEGMLIDEYLVDSPSRTFLLTVRGESMRDAGLFPGDVVVVKRGAVPVVGDIVVAMLAGEVTVKQLAQGQGGALYLRACNPDFPDLQLAEDAEVAGVVVGQFRRYATTRQMPAG